MSEVKFKLAAGTNVGLYRQNNEDNFIVCPDLATPHWVMPQDEDYAELSPYGALLVVADGMGGMNAGEVASAIVVETIQQMFTAEAIAPIVDDSKAIVEFMENVVETADLNILNRSHTDSSTQGMGTTIVMAWIIGQRAYVCWCGDSRCYVYNGERGIARLSKDHSFVQELVDRGELDPAYASDHPLSNVITRCLGNEEKRAKPDTRIYELYDGDVIMLCSDGLCGLCQDELIEEVIAEFHESPKDCRNELISVALAKGGHDNVTVALCTVKMDRTVAVSDDEEAEDGVSMTAEGKSSGDSATDSDQQKTSDADNQQEEKSEEKEELQATLRNTPVKGRSHKFLWSVCLLLLVAVAAVCFIYINEDCAPVRQQIDSFLNEVSKAISNFIKSINSKL